jgi:hypothetical protein
MHVRIALAYGADCDVRYVNIFKEEFRTITRAFNWEKRQYGVRKSFVSLTRNVLFNCDHIDN